MALTHPIPDELASFLPSEASDFPSTQEVLALHPSPQLAKRTVSLLEKKRHEGLAESEQVEWEQIMRVEHLVRVAKARAKFYACQ